MCVRARLIGICSDARAFWWGGSLWFMRCDKVRVFKLAIV